MYNYFILPQKVLKTTTVQCTVIKDTFDIDRGQDMRACRLCVCKGRPLYGWVMVGLCSKEQIYWPDTGCHLSSTNFGFLPDFLGFLPQIFGIFRFLPEKFRISSGDVLDFFWRCFRFLPEFAELGNGQIMPANERAEILAGHWLPFIIRLRTGLKFPERTL